MCWWSEERRGGDGVEGDEADLCSYLVKQYPQDHTHHWLSRSWKRSHGRPLWDNKDDICTHGVPQRWAPETWFWSPAGGLARSPELACRSMLSPPERSVFSCVIVSTAPKVTKSKTSLREVLFKGNRRSDPWISGSTKRGSSSPPQPRGKSLHFPEPRCLKWAERLDISL